MPRARFLTLLLLLCKSVALCISGATSNSSNYSFNEQSNVIYDADTRARGFENRNISNYDFVLGGLFTIHDNSEGTRDCAKWLTRGVERAEAMLFAIDCINADGNLLPSITLGYDIRDTCHSESVGLEETLDLIIRGSRLDSQREEESRLPTLGIVGPAASRVSITSAGLGQLFEMPQVSYASSSPDLSDKDRFGYFLRTIPPDNFQARAMIDLMLHFNWTVVSIVYSNIAYGIDGRDEIIELAAERKICVEVNRGVDEDWTEHQYELLARDLESSTANVIVGFLSNPDAQRTFNSSAINSLLTSRQYTWIASETWSRSTQIYQVHGRILHGYFGIAPFTQNLETFSTYYEQLTTNSNKRDTWYPGFLTSTRQGDSMCASINCSNIASVAELPSYVQGSVIPLVVDAVYTFAHALHRFLQENCDPPLDWNRANGSCRGSTLKPLNGPNLLYYMQNVHFMSPSGNVITFDNEGNVQGLYSIVNLQATADSSEYTPKPVGVWNGTLEGNVTVGSAFRLDDDITLQFGLDNNVTVSQCSLCQPGHIKKLELSCCGSCLPCQGKNFSDDPTALACKTCGENMWGNNPQTGSDGCVVIEEIYLDFSNPWSICIVILSSLGFITVGAVVVVFAIKWKTPVIKSSGREQMILLFIGVILCFALAFIYVARPSLGTCIIQRFGLWFCLSLIFGAILVKIIRVARIFLNKKALTRLRFTEPHYQIIFTLIIVFVQVILSVASIASDRPEVDMEERFDDPNGSPQVISTCVFDSAPFLVLSIAYNSVLIVAATGFGILSFKFPRNFNEAKHISFCTFALLVIWVAFIPSYFATKSTQKEIQNGTIALAIAMSAFAVLFCICGPKVYILFFQESDFQDDSGQNRASITAGVTFAVTGHSTTKESPVSKQEDGNNVHVIYLDDRGLESDSTDGTAPV